MNLRFLLIAAVIGLLIHAPIVEGESVVWNGTSNGLWSASARWTPNHVPTSTDIAIITNSGNYAVFLDVDTTVAGLVVGAGDGTTPTFLIGSHTFTMDGPVAVNGAGSVQVVGGRFTGSTNGNGAFLAGPLICSNGILAGKITVTTNGTINLVNSSNLVMFSQTSLTNYGTVNWYKVDLYSQSNPQFFNYGLWDVKSNSTFHTDVNQLAFHNYGVFRKSGGSMFDPGFHTAFDSPATFNNTGIIDVEAGQLEVPAGSGNGVFTNTAGGNTYFDNFTFIGDSTFVGPGWVNGFLTGSNAVFHGEETFFDGVMSGTVTLANDNTLTLINRGFIPNFNSIILTNQGVVNWGVDTKSQSAQIFNYGLWDDLTNNALSGGTNGTVFNNYGTFRKSGAGDYPPESSFDSQVTFNNNGLCEIIASQVAFGPSNLGTNSTLDLCMETSIFGFVYYSSISFSGPVALVGTLTVHHTAGPPVTANNALIPVTYGSKTGTFTTRNLPHPSSPFAWTTIYDSDHLTLTVVSTTPPLLNTAAAKGNATNFSLSWNGYDGVNYQMQWTTNLNMPSWLNLGNTIGGTNGLITVFDPVSDPQRFYRLEVLP